MPTLKTFGATTFFTNFLRPLINLRPVKVLLVPLTPRICWTFSSPSSPFMALALALSFKPRQKPWNKSSRKVATAIRVHYLVFSIYPLNSMNVPLTFTRVLSSSLSAFLRFLPLVFHSPTFMPWRRPYAKLSCVSLLLKHLTSSTRSYYLPCAPLLRAGLIRMRRFTPMNLLFLRPVICTFLPELLSTLNLHNSGAGSPDASPQTWQSSASNATLLPGRTPILMASVAILSLALRLATSSNWPSLLVNVFPAKKPLVSLLHCTSSLPLHTKGPSEKSYPPSKGTLAPPTFRQLPASSSPFSSAPNYARDTSPTLLKQHSSSLASLCSLVMETLCRPLNSHLSPWITVFICLSPLFGTFPVDFCKFPSTVSPTP